MGIIVGVNLYKQNGKEYIEIDVPSYSIETVPVKAFITIGAAVATDFDWTRLGNFLDAQAWCY